MPTDAIRLPAPPHAARPVGKGRRSHFSGSLVVGDDEGWVMEVESHTEMQLALILLARPDVVELENQVPFEWIDLDGKRKTHYFDFRAMHRDGRRTAVIVKGAYRLDSPRFMDETRRIASQVTSAFADRVRLMTERDIDPVEFYNAELLYSVRDPDPEADAAARRVVSPLVGSARVGDLAAATGCGSRGYRAIIRLIRARELTPVRRERIAREALVRREAA